MHEKPGANRNRSTPRLGIIWVSDYSLFSNLFIRLLIFDAADRIIIIMIYIKFIRSCIGVCIKEQDS